MRVDIRWLTIALGGLGFSLWLGVLLWPQTEREGLRVLCSVPRHVPMDGSEPFAVIAWIDGRVTNPNVLARWGDLHRLDAANEAVVEAPHAVLHAWARSLDLDECALAAWMAEHP
ncbi:MAG: hypothetical protein H6721_19515 [Sandaracinus sp.]|nr:hypothetical protein [Sandaracinus sp.]MCB9634318.1 hypothetical protein [Sandaracinus sp.]